MRRFGPPCTWWHALHASPGRISASNPPLYVTPLVQTTPPSPASFPASGRGAPASGGGSVQTAPFGVPAFTQSAKVWISSASGGTAGGGGIGLVLLCMRTSASCAIVLLGSTDDFFMRSSYVSIATCSLPS